MNMQSQSKVKAQKSCAAHTHRRNAPRFLTDPAGNLKSFIIQTLNVKELQKLQNYFDNMPKVKCDLTYICDECGKESHLVIEGLSNFF